MKYCENCGKGIDDNAVICPNCGVPVKDSKSTSTSQNAAPTNGFAIAGFILSLFGGLLGLIFSIIGCVKSQNPTYNGKGLGLSIAGIVISCVWIFIILAISLS